MFAFSVFSQCHPGKVECTKFQRPGKLKLLPKYILRPILKPMLKSIIKSECTKNIDAAAIIRKIIKTVFEAKAKVKTELNSGGSGGGGGSSESGRSGARR